MKKRLFIYLVVTQCLIILGIIIGIIHKNKFVLGVSINTINKKEVTISPGDNLRYYYEPKPNSKIKNDPLDPNVVNTINSDTLNERYNYTIKKNTNTFRIITLGDSFTYGLHVDTKNNWTELLEDMLRTQLSCSKYTNFEIVNLGVQGYDTAYEVERYKRRGQKYQPDLILWYIVDLNRIDEKFLGEYKKIINDSLGQQKLDATGRAQMRETIFRSTYNKAKGLYSESSILAYQQSALNLIKNYFSGPLALLINPSMTEEYKNELINISKKNKFAFINNIRRFNEMNGTFQNDGHPNKTGHRIIAEDVFNYLKNSSLIHCKN